VHGSIRAEVYLPGKNMNNPNKRWLEEIRPRREAILQPLEAFRAAGHKSLEARVLVRPSADELPHWTWNKDFLTELCGVAEIVLEEPSPSGQTEIRVEPATLPECPRCWRRLEPSGKGAHPELCVRCAAAVGESKPA